MFGTNARGAFFMAREVGKRMLARAAARRRAPSPAGASSTSPAWPGLRVLPQIGVYCMSKAAVIQMTRAMALEWGRYGINVNAICPGYIDTEITTTTGRPTAGRN